MSQTLPVNGFKWIKKLSKFDEDFIRNYNENIIKGGILEVDGEVNIRKIFLIFIKISHFYQKEKKSENVISLFVTYRTKKTMLFTWML